MKIRVANGQFPDKSSYMWLEMSFIVQNASYLELEGRWKFLEEKKIKISKFQNVNLGSWKVWKQCE